MCYEAFLGEETGQRESIDTFVYRDEDFAVAGEGRDVVFGDDRVWDQVHVHSHPLRVAHRRS